MESDSSHTRKLQLQLPFCSSLLSLNPCSSSSPVPLTSGVNAAQTHYFVLQFSADTTPA